MAFFHARRALASSLIRTLSSSSSPSISSSSSRFLFSVHPKKTPPFLLLHSLRFQTSLSESDQSTTVSDKPGDDSATPKGSKDSGKKSSAPKDTILLEGIWIEVARLGVRSRVSPSFLLSGRARLARRIWQCWMHEMNGRQFAAVGEKR